MTHPRHPFTDDHKRALAIYAKALQRNLSGWKQTSRDLGIPIATLIHWQKKFRVDWNSQPEVNAAINDAAEALAKVLKLLAKKENSK